MNSKERIIAAINYKETDRLPVFPLVMTFASKLCNIPYSLYLKDAKALAEAQLISLEKFDYDVVTVCSDAYRESSACGADIEYHYDGNPHLKRTAVYSREILKTLKVPDPNKSERMSDRIEAVSILEKELKGDVPVFGWIEAPFSGAAYLRGVKDFMIDLYEDEVFVKDMLDFAFETELKFALAQIERGAKFIGIGDAAASLISPTHYEKYALPYASKLFKIIKDKGVYIKYHICGNTSNLMDLIAKLNIDIVNIDFMVDLKKARKAFTNICIKGNLDPSKVLLQGTPDEIKNKIKEFVSNIGTCGYIISPGCEVPPDTPYENLKALVDARKIS